MDNLRDVYVMMNGMIIYQYVKLTILTKKSCRLEKEREFEHDLKDLIGIKFMI